MSDTVLIGGVFDPLHAGHLAYIQEAKKHGFVHCALSDSPDKHQPLVPLDDRQELLLALGVTFVYRHESGPITDWLRVVRPKKYIKGKDWEGRLPPEEVAICEQLGIEIVFTDTVRQSSSQLLADYERRRNAQKLAAFEQWVTTQAPVVKPWVPVTDYSWEARKEIEGPHAALIAEAFELLGCRTNKFVMDYGCGYGHLVRMLRELGVKAFGYEPHLKMHEEAGPNCYGPHAGIAKEWDVVICREVLEHVPVRQWRSIIGFLTGISTKYVYVTTRFTAKPHLLDCDVADDLDPTHITMLNQDLLRTLFVLEGCKRRPDLEARLDHMKKGRVLVYEVGQ